MGIQKCLEAICEFSSSGGSLPTVQSIADMLALNTTITNIVIVERYYADKPYGGGGIFKFDASIDKTTADGGVTFDPSVSLDLQGTGSGTGCWMRIVTDKLTGDDFGMLFEDLSIVTETPVVATAQLQRYINSGFEVNLERPYKIDDTITLKQTSVVKIKNALKQINPAKMMFTNDISETFQGILVCEDDGYVMSDATATKIALIHTPNNSTIDLKIVGDFTATSCVVLAADVAVNSQSDIESLANITENTVSVLVDGDVNEALLIDASSSNGWAYNNYIKHVSCQKTTHASLVFRGKCFSNNVSKVFGYGAADNTFGVAFEDNIADTDYGIYGNIVESIYFWNSAQFSGVAAAYFGENSKDNKISALLDGGVLTHVAHANAISYSVDMISNSDNDPHTVTSSHMTLKNKMMTATGFNSSGRDEVDFPLSAVIKIFTPMNFFTFEVLTDSGYYAKFVVNSENAFQNTTAWTLRKIEGDAEIVASGSIAELVNPPADVLTIQLDANRNLYISNGLTGTLSVAYTMLSCASNGIGLSQVS